MADAARGADPTIRQETAPELPPSVSATATPPLEQEQLPRLKGHKRLLAGLHRISSSPSVARLSTSRARGYSGSGKGSISCISLNSAPYLASPPIAQSVSQDQRSAHGALPRSAVTTPALNIPVVDENARLCFTSGQDTKSSVGVPADLRPVSRAGLTPAIVTVEEDYFSRPVTRSKAAREEFNFWRDLPSELRIEILTYLNPKEVVRCSAVSKAWHRMCFDGQLWSILDTAGFYQDISGDALVKLITAAGPFVRDLNLRGCVQLRERWNSRDLTDACKNLENFSLEGCRIDRASIHNFLWSNNRLVHINLSGLAGATNHGMKIIGSNCPKLECLNISWCNNVDTKGVKHIIAGCPGIRDLRAGEIRGWNDVDLMHDMFLKNSLERLILMNCDTLTDDSFAVLIEGKENELDYLTGRPVVPARRFKHLDLTRCRSITDQSVRTLVNNIPHIEGLQLSKCHGILDTTLTELLPTTPMLTHLDLEELGELSNLVPQALANSPCAGRLRHLSISYCENIGDAGMLPVLRACTNLRSLEMDNTRIGDLVLTEAAAMVRRRTPRTTVLGPIQPRRPQFKPTVGLRLVAYDCQNVTWTGVREILFRNADVSITARATHVSSPQKSNHSSSDVSLESLAATTRIHVVQSSTFPAEVIQLKCFYTYQPTVEEHMKRVMRGDFCAARRLEMKWAEFMIAQHEAGAHGGGRRRRQRRAREAQMMHADEEDPAAPSFGVGGGRRRRARSGGCAVM